MVKRQKDRKKKHNLLLQLKRKWQVTLNAALLTIFMMCRPEAPNPRQPRSCRRLIRNNGWWNKVWHQYSEKRFKRTLRVSRGTFLYILERIRHDIAKETVTEEPISPELQLAVCLYRLGKGDYLATIGEMTGIAEPTVCLIVIEVSEAIVNNLWHDHVESLFPKTRKEFLDKMVEMESLWQFPCCFGAIDGCHAPIKCPAGGRESNKEYHNFKNFYSVALMAIVDSQYRFSIDRFSAKQ